MSENTVSSSQNNPGEHSSPHLKVPVGPLGIEGQAFVVSLHKALSRVNLYSLNHPLVGESLQECFRTLEVLLKKSSPINLSLSPEKHLILNSDQADITSGMEQALVNIFNRQSIETVLFSGGVTFAELCSLFKLMTAREGSYGTLEAQMAFLQKENVTHIQFEAGRYGRITEENSGTFAGGSQDESQAQIEQFIQTFTAMPLEGMIWDMICHAIPDEVARKKIFEIITQRIQSELESYVERATQELRTERDTVIADQKRTTAVLGQMASGQIVVDENGKVIMMNPEAEKIYGASFSELKGKSIAEVKKPDVLMSMSKEVKSTSNLDAANDVLMEGGDGTRMIVQNSTAMVQTPDGKIVGVMSILQDIAQAKELQRMQNDFIANVTHELRSPLTSIKMALSNFDTSTDPMQKHVLEIATRNVDRLGRLINDLLDSAKIGSGKMSINPVEIDPNTVLKDATMSLEPWAKSKEIQLNYVSDGALPNVLADADRLTQIVVNLISNAIKFTPKNGAIRVMAQAGTSYIRISVTDSGPGISKEDQERLFQRFAQLKQKEKSNFPGTGLGLYIAKTFVELHKGQLGIESILGQGTTFHFTLPVAPRTQQPAPSASPMATASGAVAPPSKKWWQRLFGK